MTKTVMIVVGNFVFIYTPGFIVYMFNKLDKPSGLPWLHVTTYILGWSHAFINPIIYLFFNQPYRQEFCRILNIKENGEAKTFSTNSRAVPPNSRGQAFGTLSESSRQMSQNQTTDTLLEPPIPMV